MQIAAAATPFGWRKDTLDQMKAQLAAREREPGKAVDKWKIFDAIKQAKDLLSVSDRGLTVLNALLSFHQSNTLSGEQPIIVFPSNIKRGSRAHGFRNGTLKMKVRSMQ